MGIYIRQLLAGRDFATDNYFAGQMANFIYLIGDDEERVCMVVDPAWDIPGILRFIEREDMRLIGALVTHYHPDHIGGDIFGNSISGLAELTTICPVKVHVNYEESDGVKQVTGLSDSDLERHQGGDSISIGNINVKLLHTPGHTPGSVSLYLPHDAGKVTAATPKRISVKDEAGDEIAIEDLLNKTIARDNSREIEEPDESEQIVPHAPQLFSGDTLFAGSIGRTDLWGGSMEQIMESLRTKLMHLPDETIVHPGHGPVTTIGNERHLNPFLQPE